MKIKIVISFFLLLTLCFPQFVIISSAAAERPEGFVDIKEVIPDIQLDIRYYGDHNFVGEKVSGYNAGKCIITREAAVALAKVQKDLSQFSLAIKIYDCYRPQRSVNHFINGQRRFTIQKLKKNSIRQ